MLILDIFKHLVYKTEGREETEQVDKEIEQYLSFADANTIKMLNINYAISHRERVMQRNPIRFPLHETIDKFIIPLLDDPYYQMSHDQQTLLNVTAVRRRFLAEQKQQNDKAMKEYLRLLNKHYHQGYYDS